MSKSLRSIHVDDTIRTFESRRWYRSIILYSHNFYFNLSSLIKAFCYSGTLDYWKCWRYRKKKQVFFFNENMWESGVLLHFFTNPRLCTLITRSMWQMEPTRDMYGIRTKIALSKIYRKHTISWFSQLLWNTYGCTATPGVVSVDIGFLAPNVKNLRVFVHIAELWKGFRKMKTSRNSFKSNHCM